MFVVALELSFYFQPWCNASMKGVIFTSGIRHGHGTWAISWSCLCCTTSRLFVVPAAFSCLSQVA